MICEFVTCVRVRSLLRAGESQTDRQRGERAGKAEGKTKLRAARRAVTVTPPFFL